MREGRTNPLRKGGRKLSEVRNDLVWIQQYGNRSDIAHISEALEPFNRYFFSLLNRYLQPSSTMIESVIQNLCEIAKACIVQLME